ncbi:ABC transporter ATP-binding protein [cyanobacterium endosymbiont of Epithemia turgida]|uniref:ABC transporter ATP-binding protein n=1 Tax=cyanobacterium endosymbiont of Epithemia turgida TaxID=718217 RepID=UPI0004D0CC05|nr:ATP-binding cassette domain-containing protein [cyanobacterium endosymbiont of Epithemia turgida]BAP18305.1 ABC transporter ATP-binding protein [cyanobacterium endosymbiont of Epithemia turgida isolate EtSB Lake Yunoko]
MNSELTPLLKLSEVSFTDFREENKLLTNISFQVNQSDRLAIVGPSGAGKTTLLRLINRLQDPTSGLIEWDSQPLCNLSVVKLRQQIVLVPQEPKLLGMTVEETLAYPLLLQQLSKLEIEQAIYTWQSQLFIPDDWLTRNELQLSLGQRQLVSIMRGLMMKPKLLLLDEPTSALDSDRAQQLIETLINSNETEQITIIMVSHQKKFVKQFAKYILTLKGGQIQSIS